MSDGGTWVNDFRVRAFKVWTPDLIMQTIYDGVFLLWILYYCFRCAGLWEGAAVSPAEDGVRDPLRATCWPHTHAVVSSGTDNLHSDPPPLPGLLLTTPHHWGGGSPTQPPPPPKIKRLGQIFFQAFGPSKIHSGAYGSNSFFSSAPLAHLKTQHHRGEGGVGPTHPRPTPPCNRRPPPRIPNEDPSPQ